MAFEVAAAEVTFGFHVADHGLDGGPRTSIAALAVAVSAPQSLPTAHIERRRNGVPALSRWNYGTRLTQRGRQSISSPRSATTSDASSLAEGFLAQNPDRNIARLHHPISAQSGLLTDDVLLKMRIPPHRPQRKQRVRWRGSAIARIARRAGQLPLWAIVNAISCRQCISKFQMRLARDNDVIHVLAPDRADHRDGDKRYHPS